MPTAQRPKMVRHRIQIIPIRRHLAPRVLQRDRLRAPLPQSPFHAARRQRRGHVVRQIQPPQREIHKRLELVREVSFCREALEVDEEHGREARERELLRRAPQRLTTRAIPRVLLLNHLLRHERVQALVQRRLCVSPRARGDGEREVHEGVVRRARLAAREALQAVAELALEEVDDERVVARAVEVPFLLACELLREELELGFALGRARDGRFGEDAVEVFVQPVEEEVEELLRVVLFGAGELLA